MPMTWDAAADAKLFTVVMAVYDIKISGPQNERIAKLMGDDVTAKAITHRLSKIKAHASALDPSTPASSRKRNTPTTKPTSSKTSTTKGKGSNGKHLSATHTITTLMHDTGSDDEEDFSATPSKTSKSSSFSTNATNSSAKKRKLGGGKAPKIEDADEAGFFPGMGGDDDDVGDAIDFSVGYKSNSNSISSTSNSNSNFNSNTNSNFNSNTNTNSNTNSTIKTEHQGNNSINNNKEQTIDLTAEEDTNSGADPEKHAKATAAKGMTKQEGSLPEIKKEIIGVEDVISANDDEDDEMAI